MSFLQRMLGMKLPSVDDIVTARQFQTQQEQQIQKEQQNSLPDAALANIEFILCKNGDIKIECDWLGENERLAQAYGQFMFHINEGNLKQNIAQTLINYAQKNVCSVNFINKIIEEWGRMQGDKENKPVVTPSQVIGMGKQSQDE